MQTHVMSVASITQIFAESFLKGLLAAKYCKQGFKTLKIEMGRDLNADIEVLQTVQVAHPHFLFIFNANERVHFKRNIKGNMTSQAEPPIRPHAAPPLVSHHYQLLIRIFICRIRDT